MSSNLDIDALSFLKIILKYENMHDLRFENNVFGAIMNQWCSEKWEHYSQIPEPILTVLFDD